LYVKPALAYRPDAPRPQAIKAANINAEALTCPIFFGPRIC
jgi:hypothetical protein